MANANPNSEPLILTPSQFRVYASQARFRVLVAGRRFGKTYLALTEMLKVAALPNRLIWYVGPNDGQAKRIVWDRLKALTKPHWAKRPHETLLRIDLLSGSVIIVSGAFNPDSLRGNGLDLIVLDECASLKPETWSEVLRPALADRKGRALFIGTPNGRNHFYDRYEFAKNDPEWEAFQFTTAEGGLVDDSELLSAARDLDPDSYQQEFGAQFVNMRRHRVYYTFDPAVHLHPVVFDVMQSVVWSLDFNVSPMCMLLVQRIQDVVHVLDEIVLPNGHTEAACRAFLERVEPFSAKLPWDRQPMDIHVYGDASGFQRRTSAAETDWTIIRRFFESWRGAYQVSLRTTTANPLVRDRINCVNSRFHGDKLARPRLLVHPRCRELVKDLEQVSWASDATGAATSELDKSDRNRTHLSDALGYYLVQAFPLKPLIGPQSSGRLL